MAQKLKSLPVFTELANGEVEDPRFISGHLGQSLCISLISTQGEKEGYVG